MFLTPVRRGQAITADLFNDLLGAVNSGQRIGVSGGAGLSASPAGPQIVVPQIDQFIVGKPIATIAARTESAGEITVGTGTILIWSKNTAGKLVATTRQQDVENWTEDALTPLQLTQFHFHASSGVYVAGIGDC